MAPESVFRIATKSPPSNYTFQSMIAVAEPFGLQRWPPHHSFLRLRNFPPNLDDLLLVVSSASTDVGTIAKSKTPLAPNMASGVFNRTEIETESRRAILPLSGYIDTSPIGFALDLSSKEIVNKPIPNDDLVSETKGPLPAVMILNNEGVLSAYWIVYTESVHGGTTYPGLTVALSTAPAQTTPSAPTGFASQPSAAFGTPVGPGTFGAASGLGQKASVWGSPSPSSTNSSVPGFGKPAFGSAAAPQSTNAFGAPSATASTHSVFGSSATRPTSAAFGTPSFGSPSVPSVPSSFGNSGFAAQKASAWTSNSASSTAPSTTFGSSGFPAAKTSPWTSSAAPSSTAPQTSGGFASFASKPAGFAAAAASGPSVFGSTASAAQGSVFGSTAPATQGSVFGSNAAAPQSVFGAPSQAAPSGSPTANPFGPKPTTLNPFAASSTPATPAHNPFASASKPENSGPGAFSGGSSGFRVSSSFKPDTSSVVEEPEELSTGANTSMFGSGFASTLNDASITKPANLSDADMVPPRVAAKPSFPPTTTSSIFGNKQPASKIPTPTASTFGSSSNAQKPSTESFGSSTPVSKPPSTGLFGSGTPGKSSTTSTASAHKTGFGFGQTSSVAPQNSGFSFANLSTDSAPTAAQAPSQTKVKDEPSSESAGISHDIPEAPLPPDSSSKTAYEAGDTSGSFSARSSVGNDAPLPPAWEPSKPKPSEEFDAPLPPAWEPSKPKAPAESDAPLPPDWSAGPSKSALSQDVAEKAASGLNLPCNLPTGSENDEESTYSESGEEEGGGGPTDEEEGSGEDVTKDLSPTLDASQTPQSSFGQVKTESPDNPFLTVEKSNNTRPRQLFGEVGSAPVLPPPKPKPIASPRSPSPIRSAVPNRLTRPDSSRSVSAPGMASQLLGSQRLPNKQAAPTAPSQSTFEISLEERRKEEKRKAALRERKEAEEARALIDEEDLRMQQYLAQPIEAKKTLGEFVAHVDSTAHSSMDSIPEQVEAVYRDINSMIDTLGLNARSLKEFAKGQEEGEKDRRYRIDLEVEELKDEDEWCLVEVPAFSHVIEKQLSKDLQDGCIKDVASKLLVIGELQKDLGKLHAKHQDVEKLMISRMDPEQLAISRAQPLSAEQVAQQHDLRKLFTTFQKLLSDVEQELSVLKAKLVSHAAATGNASGKPGPTIDAVMRTVAKMTSMAEKRSGDVDVLEGQMRKLRMDSVGAGSRENSPFTTPARSSVRKPNSSSTYGLFYTPESTKDDHRGFHNSLMSSTSSFSRASPDRRKLSGYSSEEKTLLRENMARKKEVTDRLRAAMQKCGGTKVRAWDDDDE